MLPQKVLNVSVRFISKSFVRDKIASLGNLGKKKTKGLIEQNEVELGVETDAKRLVNYVCGTNLLEEGGEDVKLKPDSEYPSWLKEIGYPVPLEKMDPNSKEYWKKLRKLKAQEAEYNKSLTKIGTVHK